MRNLQQRQEEYDRLIKQNSILSALSSEALEKGNTIDYTNANQMLENNRQSIGLLNIESQQDFTKNLSANQSNNSHGKIFGSSIHSAESRSSQSAIGSSSIGSFNQNAGPFLLGGMSVFFYLSGF